MLYEMKVSDVKHRLELQRRQDGWCCQLDGMEIPVDIAVIAPDRLSIVMNGRAFEVRRGAGDQILIAERTYEVLVRDPRLWRGRKDASGGESGLRKLTASMPGKVVRVLAGEGDAILAGQGIVVVEAMKMQNEIKSPKQGTLQKLLVREGMNVNAGEVLAWVE